MFKILALTLVVVIANAKEEPFSIGLGTLSPSYSQKVGKENVKVTVEQKDSGFSYTIGDPNTGTNTYLNFGAGAHGAAPAQQPSGYAGSENPAGHAGSINPAGYAGPAGPTGYTGQVNPAGYAGHAGYGGQANAGGYGGQVNAGGYGGQVNAGGYGGQANAGGYGGQVNPAGYAGQVNPAGFAGGVNPAGYAGQVNPAGFAGGVNPAGYAGQMNSIGFGSPSGYGASGATSFFGGSGSPLSYPSLDAAQNGYYNGGARQQKDGAGEILPAGFSYHGTDGQAFLRQGEAPNFVISDQKESKGPAEHSFGLQSRSGASTGGLAVGSYAGPQYRGVYKEHGGHA